MKTYESQLLEEIRAAFRNPHGNWTVCGQCLCPIPIPWPTAKFRFFSCFWPAPRWSWPDHPQLTHHPQPCLSWPFSPCSGPSSSLLRDYHRFQKFPDFHFFEKLRRLYFCLVLDCLGGGALVIVWHPPDFDAAKNWFAAKMSLIGLPGCLQYLWDLAIAVAVQRSIQLACLMIEIWSAVRDLILI